MYCKNEEFLKNTFHKREKYHDNLERHFDCGKSILHISSSKNYYTNFYDISFLLFFSRV